MSAGLPESFAVLQERDRKSRKSWVTRPVMPRVQVEVCGEVVEELQHAHGTGDLVIGYRGSSLLMTVLDTGSHVSRTGPGLLWSLKQDTGGPKEDPQEMSGR